MCLWFSISVINITLCLNMLLCLLFNVEVKQNLSTCQWRFSIYMDMKLCSFFFLLPNFLYWFFFTLFFYVVLFVIQLCRIVGGQRYTKKLNDQQVKALLKATCQRPRDREENINKVQQCWILSSHINIYCLIDWLRIVISLGISWCCRWWGLIISREMIL